MYDINFDEKLEEYYSKELENRPALSGEELYNMVTDRCRWFFYKGYNLGRRDIVEAAKKIVEVGKNENQK